MTTSRDIVRRSRTNNILSQRKKKSTIPTHTHGNPIEKTQLVSPSADASTIPSLIRHLTRFRLPTKVRRTSELKNVLPREILLSIEKFGSSIFARCVVSLLDRRWIRWLLPSSSAREKPLLCTIWFPPPRLTLFDGCCCPDGVDVVRSQGGLAFCEDLVEVDGCEDVVCCCVCCWGGHGDGGCFCGSEEEGDTGR